MSGSPLLQLAGRSPRSSALVDGRTVVLVDPYWTRNKDPRVPLGHGSLLAALRRAGVAVHSLPVAVNAEARAVERLADDVLDRCAGLRSDEVDVAVGTYVWGEAVVQRLLPKLRARGFRGRIILGGPQISYAGPGLERLYPEADGFVRGYGEEALVRLAGRPGRPRIPGVHHAGDDDRVAQADVDLEQLASPWLDGVIPLDGQRFVRWETQRGCPFRCSFCQHREPGARLVRRQLARARVLAEVDLFCSAGVGEIAVLDPIFTPLPGQGAWATAVLERFAAQHFRGRLALQCRAELIDHDFLAATRGLDLCLELGLQTIHPTEGHAVYRNNNVAIVERVLADLRRHGLDHEVSLIFGLPGQTLASFVASVGWCLARRVPTIKAFPLLLLRGTALERERARWGYHDDGGPMAMVTVSTSFSHGDWCAMSRIAEALRQTEGRHPATIEEVLALAGDLRPDLGNWQAPGSNCGDA